MAETISFEVKGYNCLRCGHLWQPRGGFTPTVCPKCRSPYWDTPRRRRQQAATAQDQEQEQGETKA